MTRSILLAALLALAVTACGEKAADRTADRRAPAGRAGVLLGAAPYAPGTRPCGFVDRARHLGAQHRRAQCGFGHGRLAWHLVCIVSLERPSAADPRSTR